MCATAKDVGNNAAISLSWSEVGVSCLLSDQRLKLRVMCFVALDGEVEVFRTGFLEDVIV